MPSLAADWCGDEHADLVVALSGGVPAATARRKEEPLRAVEVVEVLGLDDAGVVVDGVDLAPDALDPVGAGRAVVLLDLNQLPRVDPGREVLFEDRRVVPVG